MMSWFFLVSARVQVLVSLLLSFFLFFGMAFCSTMISWFLVIPALVLVLVSHLLSSFLRKWCSVSWFWLGFRCLFPFFSLLSFLRKRVLFHHDLLVAPGSGSGSGGCLPSYLFFFRKGGCVPS